MVPFTIRRTATLAAVLFLTAFTFACSDHPDNGLITGTRAASSRSSRVFTQRERLGNPLVSEVMIRKARHHDHNTGIPSTDVAEFTGDLTGFVTGVAGRDAAYANTIAGALLPDMLVTYPRRDNANPR